MHFHHSTWHEEQQRFERERTGRDIVLKSRQIGFSTLELMRGLYLSSTRNSFNTVVAGHDQSLVQDLFESVRFAAEGLEAVGKLPGTTRDTVRMLRFGGLGSTVSVTEAGATERSASKKGHSGTIHRLHATEVARWAEPAESMKGFLGAVPDDGEVVIESVAAGAGGWFYDHVMDALAGRGRYKLHFYPWFEHLAYRAAVPDDFDPSPCDDTEKLLRSLGCDDEQIAWWRGKVEDFGDDVLEQYPPTPELAFRASGRTWFDQRDLDAIASEVRPAIRDAPIVFRGQRFGTAKIFAEPVPGGVYVVFGDPSEGVAGDGSSATVLEARTGHVVATWWSDTVAPGDFGLVLAVLGWLYNEALVGAERNNHGHATLRALQYEAGYGHVYYGEDARVGWHTTPQSRPVMWGELFDAIGTKSASTPDADALAECRTIIRDEDGQPRARDKRKKKKGACRDDRFVSWAGAWQIRGRAVARVGGLKIPGL